MLRTLHRVGDGADAQGLTFERPCHTDVLTVTILEYLMVFCLFVCFILQCVSCSVVSESLQPHGLSLPVSSILGIL